MKITKSQLRQLVKEEFDKEYPPAIEIQSRANMIKDIINRSVIKMVEGGYSTESIVEVLQHLARLARQIEVKAKALPRE
jgi:DNA-binding transcriptional regulator YhcF (GntR family)